MNEDDDFPINSASSKLANLFSDNVKEDVSFIYNPQPPKPKQVKNPPPLSVITGCTVDAFQLKKNGYAPEGKLGLVILGNDELPHYKIYMYRNDENKVASCDITPNFNLQVQENNYISFQDSNGITWSLHFEKTSNLISFCRELCITKWKSGQNKINSIKQDGYKGSSNHPVTNEDKVEIKIDLFLIENNEKLTSCTKEAGASSNIWPVNPVGKCLDGVFFMITQSELLSGFTLPSKQIMLVEMSIKNVIRQQIEEIPKSIPKLKNSPPPQSSEKNPDDEIDKNISERMMKIGYQLPSFQPETENEKSFSKNSSIAKDDIPGTPSEMSFDVSLNSQLNVFLSEVRIGNSEIRMNLNRVSDKVESLIHKVNSCEEMNYKWKPFADKVSSLEDCISSLVEQNQKTISILRQPDGNKAIVAEVSDLNKKNQILEESLKNANSAIKNLEGRLQFLQDKIQNGHDGQNNYLENRVKDLEKNNKDLENQNSVLTKHVSILMDEKKEREIQFTSALKEKDNFIKQMRKSMDLLSGQLNHYEEREIMERDLNVWIKRVLNWADKALKAQLKDLTNNNSLDTVISETLLDVANEFFGRYTSSSDRRSRTDSSSDKNSSKESTPHGNIRPKSNPGNPLPKPKPRQIDKTEQKTELNNNPIKITPPILNELPPLPTITEDDPPMNELNSSISPPEKEEDISFMWKEKPPPLPVESDEESDDLNI